MKHSRRILVFLIAMLLQIALLTTATAATVERNGLKLDFTTDQTSYSAGDSIICTLDLNNTGEEELSFSYEVVLPEGLELVTTERSAIVVGSEEKATSTFSLSAPGKGADSVPSTGDDFPIGPAVILFAAAMVVCLALVKNKKRFMAFMLVFVLFFGLVEPMMSAPALAEEDIEAVYEDDGVQEDYAEEYDEDVIEQIWFEEEQREAAAIDPVFEVESAAASSFSFNHNVYVDNKLVNIRVDATISGTAEKEAGVATKASLATPKFTSIRILGVTRFRLNWAKVAGATHYEVWHKQSNGKYIKKTTTTNNTYYTNYGRKGVINVYKVRAVKKSGSTTIKSAYGTCTCYGMDAPKIRSIGHTSSSSADVRLRWWAGSYCTGFKVYRSTNGASGSYKLVSTTTGKAYIDSRYNAHYKVRPYYRGKNGVTYLGPVTAATSMPPQYRALIVGQSYPTWSSGQLPGCLNDAQGMKAMLGSMTNPKYRPFDVKLRTNLTSTQILNEIKYSFQRAKVDDVSLFYYSGHGTGTSGWLCGVDSEYAYDYVTVDDLRNALDQVPGKKIVILDSCYSGQFINKANKALGKDVTVVSDEEAMKGFNDAIIAGFASSEKANLATSNYYVLTACSKYQTSQELISGGTRFGMFTYNLLWGSGYDEIDDTFLSKMYADVNSNRKLTLNELFNYAYSEVNDLGSYLGITQTVRVYPTNSSFVCWGK